MKRATTALGSSFSMVNPLAAAIPALAIFHFISGHAVGCQVHRGIGIAMCYPSNPHPLQNFERGASLIQCIEMQAGCATGDQFFA